MNPARTFGPALVTSHWKHHWVGKLGLFSGDMLVLFKFKLAVSLQKFSEKSVLLKSR